MKYIPLCLCLITLTAGAQAATKSCVFQDAQLGSIMYNEGPYKVIAKDDKVMGLPTIFASYPQLGEFDAIDCQDAVRSTKVVSFVDHKVYTFYFTNKDRCDGGNSYGLILGTAKQSPNRDKVVAIITDGDIDCL